jgi:hypothetical protein
MTVKELLTELQKYLEELPRPNDDPYQIVCMRFGDIVILDEKEWTFASKPARVTHR